MKIKYKDIKWTEQDFINATGHEPEQDDLERCNCEHKNEIDHQSCGICEEHNMPVFMCHECFHLVNIDERTYINDRIDELLSDIMSLVTNIDINNINPKQLDIIKLLNNDIQALKQKRDSL